MTATRQGCEMGIENIVNELSKGWEIIKDGKAHADVASGKSCNAVPKVDDWQNLHEGHHDAAAWRSIKEAGPVDELGPGPFTYIDVLYHISYTYGATYNGRGMYIPSCTVMVERCIVRWQFSVNVSLEVLETDNAGSDDYPVAHLRVKLSEEWSWPFETKNQSAIYDLYGDGKQPQEEVVRG